MNSNHSIDVEAALDLLRRIVSDNNVIFHNSILLREVEEALAAKRSIPANTGTIGDDPMFRDLVCAWAAINLDAEGLTEGHAMQAEAWRALIAHIDARLNAATTEKK